MARSVSDIENTSSYKLQVIRDTTMSDRRSTSGGSRRLAADAGRRGQQQIKSGSGTRPAAKKFTGKNEGMKGSIFDIGAGMANRFNETHQEIQECIARTLKQSHGASRAIKELTSPVHNTPAYPTLTMVDLNYVYRTVRIPEEQSE
uniref:Uncharacterized protein n=1 Tax=Odontella aurita TaxID=265563 RepID=A0A7S4NEG6_9STRA|mmetsp:Transcript_59729/g.176989  ORF Transcript_59729/g.176989 Transcript_59729/m.176989 type:complete len:146 (+) Transcript_59729:117-554(+)